MELHTIDLNQPAPATEPERQYYFMEKAKKENITFSKDEISVLFEEARKGMSS